MFNGFVALIVFIFWSFNFFSYIRMILNDKAQYEKYEDFMVRRVLAVYADTRWCPAPDCRYSTLSRCCIHILTYKNGVVGDIFELRKKRLCGLQEFWI
jgi:hypothetical protein